MPKCFPKVLPSSASVQMGIKATGFPVQIGENIDALTNSQNQTPTDKTDTITTIRNLFRLTGGYSPTSCWSGMSD
jgi:hypothetical protein